MTIETTIFNYKISNKFEDWPKIFDSSKIDEFHKSERLSILFREKFLTDPQEAIVIDQAEEGIAKYIFSNAEKIKRIEGGGHIYITTKTTGLLSN